MQERAFGTVQGGIVVPRGELPEGASVEVHPLGAPPDVLQRLRGRPLLAWRDMAVKGDASRGHAELIDCEVPAVLRYHGADGLLPELRALALKHFPTLERFEVEANENGDEPGSVWLNVHLTLPTGTAPHALRRGLQALEAECAAARLAPPGLLLAFGAGVAEE